MIFYWDMDFIYRAFLIFLRLGALLFFIPFFNASGIPAMVRVGFALLLTNIVAMVIPQHPPLPADAIDLVIAGVNELLVGLFMGLIIRVAFQTVSMAGELISVEGGFMRDASFNSFNQQSDTAVERLLYNFAVVVFLTTGMHLEVFQSFIKSFDVVHLGHWMPSAATINGLIASTAQIFTVSVQIAAPFIALNFVINMTFAVLGKAVPQMNAFVISFAVLIVGGLVTFACTLDVIAQYIITVMRESAGNMLYLLQLH